MTAPTWNSGSFPGRAQRRLRHVACAQPHHHFEDPVFEDSSVEFPKENGHYALTRRHDVAEVSRHPEIFISGPGMVSQLDWPPEMVEHFSRMISTDNPKHDRLRPIVSTAFNRRTIKTVEDSIERVADEVTSRALSHGSRYFINDVATPFPLEIISTMMNVPPSEYGTVLHSSNVILSMGEASAALTAIMKELGQYRVTHPIDDITSTLVNATIEFATLTQQELASFFNLLVTAGIETTRTAIDHGLHALSEHPDQKARMVADFEGLAATATDAIIR